MPGSRAEQRNQDEFQVAPFCKGFCERFGRRHPGALEFLKDRRLFHSCSNVERNGDQEKREQERNAPAPVIEALLAERVLDDQNHSKGDEITKGGGDLNETGVEASLIIRRVLGDVDRGAAILATDRQTLQQSQGDQDNWREPPGGRIGGQKANPSGPPAHDNQRHQKGIFAAHQIADPTEEQRAEGPDHEAYREGRQVGQVSEGVVARWVELQGQDGGETAEDKEVVPLDHRSEGRRQDDMPYFIAGGAAWYARSTSELLDLFDRVLCHSLFLSHFMSPHRLRSAGPT